MARPLLLLLCLALSGCDTLSRSDPYSSTSDASKPSYEQEGGAGVEAPIWSSDPNKKTITKKLQPSD